MTTKTFTIAEFLDAIEKDGYPKLTNGTYWATDENGNEAGCAYGQATVNLGFDPELSGGVHSAVLAAVNSNLQVTSILYDNDHTNMTLPEIAEKYRILLKEFLSINATINIDEDDDEN